MIRTSSSLLFSHLYFKRICGLRSIDLAHLSPVPSSVSSLSSYGDNLILVVITTRRSTLDRFKTSALINKFHSSSSKIIGVLSVDYSAQIVYLHTFFISVSHSVIFYSTLVEEVQNFVNCVYLEMRETFHA